MKSDLPCTVTIVVGATVIPQIVLADSIDAYQFVHAQARAGQTAGATHLAATITRHDGRTLADIDVTSYDLCGATRKALADSDDAGGLTYARVDGIDAVIYAHRSSDDPDALAIGVDADEDQRILFCVNDGDLVDTTVGYNTGRLDLNEPYAPTMTVSATIAASSPHETERILTAAACAHPIHFH